MGYWSKLATDLDTGILKHPWAGLLRSTLERVKPEMFQTLDSFDELDSFLVVRVSEALAELARLTASGMDAESATETALESLLPMAAEDIPQVEDYEIEGGHEDAIAGLETYLNNKQAEQ